MRTSYLRWVVLFSAAGCGGETDGKSIEASITELCREAVQLPCRPFDSQNQCEAELHEGRIDAAGDGCSAQFEELVRCVARFPLTCKVDDDSVVVELPPACQGFQDTLNRCNDRDDPPPPATGGAGGAVPDPECGVGFGTGASGGVTCMHVCTDFSAICEGPSQTEPLTCFCANGPQTGRTFEARDCSSGIVAASTALCKGP